MKKTMILMALIALSYFANAQNAIYQGSNVSRFTYPFGAARNTNYMFPSYVTVTYVNSADTMTVNLAELETGLVIDTVKNHNNVINLKVPFSVLAGAKLFVTAKVYTGTQNLYLKQGNRLFTIFKGTTSAAFIYDGSYFNPLVSGALTPTFRADTVVTNHITLAGLGHVRSLDSTVVRVDTGGNTITGCYFSCEDTGNGNLASRHYLDSALATMGGGGTAGSGINLNGGAINLGAYLTTGKTILNRAINPGDTVALLIGDSIVTPDNTHYLKGVGCADNQGMFSGIIDASPFGGSSSTYLLGNLNYYNLMIDSSGLSLNTTGMKFSFQPHALGMQNYTISNNAGTNGQVLMMDSSNVASFQSLTSTAPDTNYYATHAYVENNFLQASLSATTNQVLYDSAGVLVGSNNMLFYNNLAPILNVAENGNGMIATGQIQLSPAGVTIGIQGGGSSYGYLLPNSDGAPGQYLTTDGSGHQSWQNPGWRLNGNAGTDPATNFIGTTDGADLLIQSCPSDSNVFLQHYKSGSYSQLIKTNEFAIGSTDGHYPFQLLMDNNIVPQMRMIGSFQYQDGTQGSGKVLTSDASGNASWTDTISATVAPFTMQSCSTNLCSTIYLYNGLTTIQGTSGLGGAYSTLTTQDNSTQIITVDSSSPGMPTASFIQDNYYGSTGCVLAYSDTLGNTDSVYVNSEGIRLSGKLQIINGTQGTGKVFTSDALGNASWQTPIGGGANFDSLHYKSDAVAGFEHTNPQHAELASCMFYLRDSANHNYGAKWIAHENVSDWGDSSVVEGTAFSKTADSMVIISMHGDHNEIVIGAKNTINSAISLVNDQGWNFYDSTQTYPIFSINQKNNVIEMVLPEYDNNTAAVAVLGAGVLYKSSGVDVTQKKGSVFITY